MTISAIMQYSNDDGWNMLDARSNCPIRGAKSHHQMTILVTQLGTGCPNKSSDLFQFEMLLTCFIERKPLPEKPAKLVVVQRRQRDGTCLVDVGSMALYGRLLTGRTSPMNYAQHGQCCGSWVAQLVHYDRSIWPVHRVIPNKDCVCNVMQCDRS